MIDFFRYDGVNDQGTVLFSQSGQLTTRTYVTASTPNAFLKFTSDGSITGTGFRLEWNGVYD